MSSCLWESPQNPALFPQQVQRKKVGGWENIKKKPAALKCSKFGNQKLKNFSFQTCLCWFRTGQESHSKGVSFGWGLLVSFHTHALSKCFELVLLKIGEKPL